MARHHQRRPTFPLANESERKPRRWPLVLRFYKGAIHADILAPVVIHALFAALVVWVDNHKKGGLGLPSSIIPSISIVVGLMLVFRNGTSYDRYWSGRNNLTTISVVIRNLTRSFLVCSYTTTKPASPTERADTERTVRTMIAMLYAIKNHLRNARSQLELPPPPSSLANSTATLINPEYTGFWPEHLPAHDAEGLSLPLQLSIIVEAYIKRGVDRGWFNAPQSAALCTQLSTLVDAYSRMDTIRLTPIPVAHQIHQKQVLALYCCVLPFALVDEMIWWSVPIVSLVAFTLYGIEGIGSQLEDPFGLDKNDIRMDAIVEDVRCEVMVLLNEWKDGGEMFGKRFVGEMG